MKRLFLLDAYELIYRAYYAFMRMPRINSKGMNTSAIFGFVNTLDDVLTREKPSHLAVVFDPSGPTFRHEAYEEYKANREATPEDIRKAVPIIKQIVKAYRIPVIEVPGYEADDVIGTLAKKAGEMGNIDTYMITPDKDYGQLITQNIFQYKPGKGGNEVEIIGKEQVCENYGICNPQQVIDILTIWGDSSDNVPGIRGIGEVGAKKLIGKYGSLENIIAHADELPAKQQEAVKSSLEQIQMSRFLVTIKRDIQLPLGVEEITLKGTDSASVDRIFNRYELN